jgi:hypothetical protein
VTHSSERCVTWDYRNFVVPAKAGTQWRIRANVA